MYNFGHYRFNDDNLILCYHVYVWVFFKIFITFYFHLIFVLIATYLSKEHKDVNGGRHVSYVDA